MERKYMIIILIVFLCYFCTQEVQVNDVEDSEVMISLDTIYLSSDSIEFNSDIVTKLSNCHQSDSFEIKQLEKDKILTFLGLLDRRFETNIFSNSVKVITGKSIIYKTQIPQKKFHSDMNIQ